MWTGAIVLSLVAAVSSAGSQPAPAADCATWQACRDAVEAAISDESFERALDLAWRAVQKGPKDDPALMFLLARAEARAGRPQDALVMVRRLAERGVRTEALAHPDLERVRNLDAWAEVEPLVTRANEGAPAPAATPIRAPKPASPAPPAAPPPPPPPSSSPTVPPPPAPGKAEAAPRTSRGSRGSIPIDSTGLPEDVLRFTTDRFTPSGLAYDAVSRRFVVGDQRGRKLRVVGEGQDHAVDLVRSESAGFLDIRALVIDTHRGDLWVVTSAADGAEGTLHRIQLVSGRPLQAVPLPSEADHPIQPVDLAIADSGAVFLLDRDGRIQRVRAGTATIETVVALKGVEDASSLALASNDTVAYVADAKGLHRVDLRSGAASTVTSAAELPLTGLERLRAHRGGFVALQRSPDGERRLLRLELNRAGRAVRAATTYDVRVEVGSPTAFAVSGDDLSIVTGIPASAADVDSSPAVGPPAELAVRRFRLR